LENQKEIYRNIANAMADIEAIAKNQKNRDQGFQYRGIDDVYNALNPILARHKIFSVPTVLEREEKDSPTKSGAIWKHVVLKVRYDFYTVDGSFISAIVFGEGKDSSDKGSNKALAIAHKYALLQIFCIPTLEDKDPDGQTVPEITTAKDKPTAQKENQSAIDKNLPENFQGTKKPTNWAEKKIIDGFCELMMSLEFTELENFKEDMKKNKNFINLSDSAKNEIVLFYKKTFAEKKQ
jgi:hypothetical protein